MKRRVSYNPLWKILIDKNMNREGLREISGVSSSTIAKLGKGANVSTDVLIKICDALDCEIQDIIETVPDDGQPRRVLDL